MDIGAYLEYDVRDVVGTFEVGRGVRIFWRGFAKRGFGRTPLVTGMQYIIILIQSSNPFHSRRSPPSHVDLYIIRQLQITHISFVVY